MLIALDDETTWPQSIVPIVERLLPSSQRPMNPDLLRQILDQALPHDIVGFHATRLHRVHIELLKNGTRTLVPLSPENERDRVYDVVRHGDLSEDEAEALLATSRVHESSSNIPIRQGSLYLYFTNSVFKKDICFKFFRYWGGESLGQYGAHKEILKKIGIPCVVEVKVPIRFVRSWISGKDFVNAYTQNHGGKYIDEGMYGAIDNPACPVTVRNIIEFVSDRFTEMTSGVDWREPIHP